jgi:hypothetical protein
VGGGEHDGIGDVVEEGTYTLNCMVRLRYTGDTAYAMPPATTEKVPHCKRECQ